MLRSRLEVASPIREGRLQRPAGPHGTRITRFREVLRRHGLLVLLVSVASLALPGSLLAFERATRSFFSDPMPYLLGGVCLLASLLLFSRLSNQPLDRRQVLWIFYLLGISIGEEWVYRLALPSFLGGHVEYRVAIVMSNLIFAAIHYFTLRWRTIWVTAAFLGGMGLSNLMEEGDLVLVIGAHWLGTFANTRHPPRSASSAD